jgi:gliding motility-associated-like protein
MFIIICSFLGYVEAQTISVDDQNYTAQTLSELLLKDGCIEIDNASFSDPQSVAYFNNNDGEFPIDEGVLIRSGNAEFSEGQYSGDNMSSQLNNNSDPFLEDQIIGEIEETAFLEFEFVPLSTSFNFNFIFASNEYGQWQCVGSDTFAFVLTNLNTGEETNIAILPNSNGQRVSIKNIRDNSFNSACNSQNPNLFSTFNPNDPINSSVNMRGYSKLLNVSADITPGVPYQARLIMVDVKDDKFDSAVFLEAGGFDSSLNLGDDKKLCSGSTSELNTHLDPEIYNHQWSFNGNLITNENDSLLTVTEVGQYSAHITKDGSNCILQDTVLIEPINLETPANLTVCNTGNTIYDFNLTDVRPNDLGLSNSNYDLVYYESVADAQIDSPISQNIISSYSSTGNETIIVRALDENNGILCGGITQFDLIINDPIEANEAPDIQLCIENINDPAQFNLTQNNPAILSNTSDNDYSVTFYSSEIDAENGQNAFNDPQSVSLTSANSQLIWVRVEDEIGCFDLSSFEIKKNEKPRVSVLSDTLVCSAYVLPPIQFGNYYTAPGGPQGNGTELAQGDIIDKMGTYYIFNGPDENGCTNQSSFKVKIIEDFQLPTQNCGPYTLPTPLENIGTYYTAPDGPNGTGTELPPGTVITQTQTIYYYAVYEGSFCTEKPFPIEILTLPLVDQPDDYITCDSYTLPALNNGNYYTESGGNGNQLPDGAVLTESQKLYIFNDNGTCTNQHSFNVVIPLDYQDVVVCDSYLLPEILGGGYYVEPYGQGMQIPENEPILQSQTIYYYADTDDQPNCTEDLSFEVTVFPSPPVDTLQNQLTCINDLYTLPELTDGQYFTRSDREGSQLNAGDEISETKEIFINNSTENCSSETSFTVEVLRLPGISLPTNVYECSNYTLPEIESGRFYSEPAGSGEQLYPGEVITETQTLYIYEDYEQLTSCYTEEPFDVIIRNAEVGEFEDVNNCGPYVLPELNFGNYYTQENGGGELLKAGDTLFNDQTVYVFGIDGDRFPCTDQEAIEIDISPIPVLPDFEDIDKCGEFILPVGSLPSGPEFESGFYKAKNAQEPMRVNTLGPGVYKVYAYAAAIDNPNCFKEDSLIIKVYPRPEINVSDGIICKDFETGETIRPYIFETGIDEAEYTVNWFKDGQKVSSGATFTTGEPGDYTVRTIKHTAEGANDCNYEPESFTVTEPSQPVVSIELSRDFSDNTYIRVNVIQGIGPYEYQLDDRPYAKEGIFTNVNSGTHIIKIRSLLGACQLVVKEVEILKYPKFFTPNQDGTNDKWNIPDLKNVADAKIFIFDRYGKLLMAINPNGRSWDGTFNGKRMPSNEYWFRAEYVKDGKQKVFKSHFTLKR